MTTLAYALGIWIAAVASFNSNGVAISYTDSGGRGEPVVLIHGFTGTAERHFGRTGMADALERKDASALIRGVSADPNGGPSDAQVAAAAADLFSRNDPHVLAVMARTLPVLWDVSRDQLRKVKVPVFAVAGEFEADNVE